VSDPLSDREVRRRLAVLRHVEEVTGNVAMTARYFGISRQVYYTWLRRYRTEGLEGLRDRSRRPNTCPHATDAEVIGKIIHLRENYHFCRPHEDFHVSQALPRRVGQQLGGVAHPQTAGSQPVAGLAALRAQGPALETL
jgi:hypothetical protein